MRSSSARRRAPTQSSRIRTTAGLLLALLAAAAAARAAGLDDFDLASEPVVEWKLPKRLREISGLASIGERVFAHDDETATIYELDLAQRKITKSFRFGDPAVHGDFEGLAVVGDRFYLVTSKGWLFSGSEGGDGESVPFRAVDTGIGRECEIEGLAVEPSDHTLLILCKRSRTKALRHFVVIHRWSLAEDAAAPHGDIVVPLGEVTSRIGGDDFEPSGIEREPASGNYFLVAAKQAAMAEITPAGRVVSARNLSPGRHRQVEGVAFTPSGGLVLGDEGGKNRARIAVYPPRPTPSTSP